MPSSKKIITVNDIKNPPAWEAIIEIRFSAPEEVLPNEIFSKIESDFQDDFPVVKKRMRATTTVDVNNQNIISHDPQLVGLQLQSSDNEEYESMGFHADRLIVSNVGQYCGGDHLIELFKKALSSYKKHFNPADADRLAMRYINKVDYDADELSEKLNVLPLLPSVQETIFISDMLCSFSVADEQLVNKANLNYFFKTNEDNEDNGKQLEVIIDIDSFQDSGQISLDWGILESKLKVIRAFKNQFFEKSFTQKGLEDFL